MAPPQVQWGTITLDLDNETFRKAFSQGRSMYFDDGEYDIPHIAHHMNPLGMQWVQCWMKTARAAIALIAWRSTVPLTL
jgi:hypothetical protein